MTIAMISLCVAILLLSWVTWALNKKIEHLEKIVNNKGCNYPLYRTGGIGEYINNDEMKSNKPKTEGGS